jgi:probable F420-dependent oxidoreductase
MDLGKFGVWLRRTEWEAGLAAELEGLGYGSLWIGGSPSGNLEDVERVLEATDHIPVATGIVNMWREDPAIVGPSFLRLNAAHPDRVLLGVGIGHPEATDEYTRPVDKIDEYLNRLTDEGVPMDRVVLAALGPRVLAVAASRTAGAHPYLTTPRHTRMARRVMGSASLLAPEQKVIVGLGEAESRRIAREMVGRYLGLVNYRHSLLREGWPEESLENGGDDRLIDELVLHGDVEGILDGLRAHLDGGADHVSIQAPRPDARMSYRELASALF